jgi:antitoxin component YwqK of YwqJK toxin-antitoxin module
MKQIKFTHKLSGLLFLLVILIPLLFYSFSQKNDSKKNQYFIKNGLIFNSAQNKIFSGRIIDTVDAKIIEYDVVNGRKNGDFSIFYSDGNIQIKGKMKDNKNSGEWKYYYPSGQLESIGNFNNDVVSDEWRWFYDNGIIKEEGKFINGKREGKWNLYDRQGKLKTILYFNNGKVITKLQTGESQSA